MPDSAHKVHIPEVLPPVEEEQQQEQAASRDEPGYGGRMLAGLVIDALDFILRGPVGLRLGVPVGFLAGLIVGRLIGLSYGRAVVLGAAAGIYCTIPGTSMLPLGTIIAMLGKKLG